VTDRVNKTEELNDLESTLVRHVHAANYQPVKPRVIARQLRIPRDKLALLRRTIKSLVRKGHLLYGERHLVKPARQSAEGDSAPPQQDQQPVAQTKPPPAAPASRPRRPTDGVYGHFQRAAAGFGFVRPEGTPADQGRDQDIFIPTQHTLDAASGDLVHIVLNRGRDQKRPRGRIMEIIERRTRQFVGTYKQENGTGSVQIDGTLFSHSVPVGDSSARNVQPEDKVVVEMVHFPSASSKGEAVLLEVLGKKGDAGVETLTVLREFQLPGDFSEAVMKDARRQADQFDDADLSGRIDLTEATIITIDPADARDFDDAISLRKLENGHWRLGVHIADVAHFVPRGSKLDEEAYRRATSIYLPDQVIPMLPEIISNNLASLQPDQRRYARSVFMEMTAEGVVVDTEVASSVIRSRQRFTYEEVDQFLEDRQPWRSTLSEDVFTLLEQMHELAMKLRARRLKRGSLELGIPEVKIELDEEGRVTGARLTKNTVSHQVIEELMLAANQSVAEFFVDRKLLFMRRLHGDPNTSKLDDLAVFAGDMGIECESIQSRFDIIKVIDQARGQVAEQAIFLAILRSLKKAIYSPLPERHYALNMDHYCHFTSPIRRYPDLLIHRMLDDLAANRKPQQDQAAMQALGDHCSEMEQRAAAAERQLVKLKLLHYLAERIGEQMEAVVTGVEEFGLFVQGVQLPADGLLAIESLPKDTYQYDAQAYSLVGFRQGNQFQMGDLLLVEVKRVDLEQRKLDFELVKIIRQPGKSQLVKKMKSKPPTRKPGKQESSSRKTPRRGKRKRR
jgi:ribonuclease R